MGHEEFWDEHTGGLGDADPALYGTVTEEAAAVRLRDRLERAHIGRAVPLCGSERVLDLGGGAGRIALWLAPRVSEVTVLDESASLLEVGRRTAASRSIDNVRFVRGSATEAPLGGPYDLIVVSGLLTHLDDADVASMVDRIAAALRPDSGRLVLKEPVTTDGVERADRRAGYVARFRPRQRYTELFSARLPLLYQRATLAHPIPFFIGGTESAARSTRHASIERVIERLTPLWVRLDPILVDLEEMLRANPVLSWLLAPVPVLQDLYVFGAPRTARSGVRPELSVVMIAFNEEECLGDVVEELVTDLTRAGVIFELVLVDDGSSDGTLASMQRLAAADGRMAVVPLSPNRGIGGALRAGFDAARGTYVTWVPADGQIAPDTVLTLFLRRDEAPMLTTVYESRDDAFYRHLISHTLNALIRVKTGQVAVSGGNYLFARDAWRDHAPRDDDTMMISTAFRKNLDDAGVPIVRVPIRARARVAGRSKVLNPRTIARTFAAMLSIRR